MDFNYDNNNPESGKPSSYANYMEYLLQNYYDNFEEVLDPFDTHSAEKIDILKSLPGYQDYNISEKRFPNATIESYKRFIKDRKNSELS